VSGTISLVILAAGRSSRFGRPVAKQWLRSGDDPLWQVVTEKLLAYGGFERCIVTTLPEDASYMKHYAPEGVTVVKGGAERQDSLRLALEHVTSEYVLVTDVARACVDEKLLGRLLAERGRADCVVPYLPVVDTTLLGSEPVDRDALKRIQTPQLSRTALLKSALKSDRLFTDESTLIAAHGGTVHYVLGDEAAGKLTHGGDIRNLGCIKPPAIHTLTGNGFDVHAFEEGREMKLGGITIEVPYGFKAHSDGDVAIHALVDALLGAAGAGDIGELFPDTDEAFKGADSAQLLDAVMVRLERYGYEVVNADVTIMAQAPRLGDYKEQMRVRLAKLLHIPSSRMNVKATTTEKLGFVGRKEGVAVMATATLKYFDWMQER